MNHGSLFLIYLNNDIVSINDQKNYQDIIYNTKFHQKNFDSNRSIRNMKEPSYLNYMKSKGSTLFYQQKQIVLRETPTYFRIAFLITFLNHIKAKPHYH